MASFKLTQAEVSSQCEQFLYVFASDDFCNALGSKASAIIRAKRANQNKILYQSAQSNGTTLKAYQSAVREAFIGAYGITPAEALIKLAKGETVAGKNWKEGVYGVSGTPTYTFTQNSHVSVHKETGKILVDGLLANGTQRRIIGTKKFPNNTKGYTWKNTTGESFTSLYDSTVGAYVAYQYVNTGKNTQQNADGTDLPKSSSADIWTEVAGWIDKLIAWIISIFGGDNDSTAITSANTSPSQEDGFVTNEAGFGTIGMVLLASVAAGTLLFGKKNKNK